MDSLLRLLMGQWTIHILWILSRKGETRFGDLRRSIHGISAKVLTERLRLLEDSGIIYRNVVPSTPPQVGYGLSEMGQDIVCVLDQLYGVAKKWCDKDPTSTTA
jgi:DNA-binding HxlR family transcriptional regulator